MSSSIVRRLSRRSLGRYVFTALLIAISAQLFAQAPSASLGGVVSDQSGAVVAGVELTLADAVRGVQRRVVSDDKGSFLFAAVPSGTYVVTVVGTGFSPVRIEGLVLADRDQRTLPITLRVGRVSEAITVRAAAPATQSASGTKTDTPLIETPRSITVITADQIQAQQVSNIDEVLRYTAGVASEFRGIDRSRTDISVRGFNWSGFVFTDGMRGGVGSYGEFDVDPFGLERVEVLRGPASILYGASSPGGLINVVTKRPTENVVAQVEADAGSFNQFGGKVDIGGPLNQSKTLLFRVTAVGRTGDSQVDTVKDSRVFVAPALTWRPGARTSVTFLGSYQKDDAPWAIFLPAEGTVLPNPNGRIPTSRHLGEEDFVDRFHREFFTPSYLIEHRADGWTLRHSLRYSRYDFHALSVSGGELHEDARTVSRYPWSGAENGHALTTDSNVQLNPRGLGRTTHRLLFGVDAKQSLASGAYGFTEGPSIDIFNPVYGAELPREMPLYQDDRQDASQAGVYAQDQIRAGRWAVSLGGRYDRAASETFDKLADATTTQHDGAFTGQAGVVYLLDNGVAPFANYAESFEPQGGSDANGNPFVPTTGTQVEAGVKYQPVGSNSLLTVSGFVITQQNVLTNDPADPRFSVQTGEIRSRGLDVDARMALPASVNLTAAYSLTAAEVTKSNGADLGHRPAQTPRSTFSVWADHTITAQALNGVRIAGGVRRTGNTLDYDNVIEVPAVTLVDAGVAYDFKGSLTGTGLSINISNLLDKSYVSSCEGLYWCMYGPRRTVSATIRHRW